VKIYRGNYELAIKNFELNLEKFREFCPVKTICMHGSPLSKYDNQKIWGKYNYRDYDIIADCYLDVDFNEVFYFTDTGRSWNHSTASVRDKVVKTEIRGWRSEVGDRRSEVGGQRTEVGGQRSEAIRVKAPRLNKCKKG